MMLSDIIIEKIKNDGPISFRDFMEMALYHPQFGYYTSEKEKIGNKGDFFTSPSFSPVFGVMIAKQLLEMRKNTGEDEFTIVEYGAGPGFLCNSILSFILQESIDLYNKINYYIIEKSPSMIREAQARVPEKVKFFESIKKLPAFKGCVLSNELVDNFSVHRVIMKNGLKEIFVDYKDKFIEVLKPASKDLTAYLEELHISLPENFQTEINLEAAHWMKDIASNLQKGYVITIDYGYPAGELLYEQKKKGTVSCYNKHKINYQPYDNIGEQDITAHVNFSALCLWGYKNGLEYCGFTNQSYFLQSLGFYEYIKKTGEPGQDYLNYKREKVLSNTLLSDMGHTIKVLIQQKKMEKLELSGLKIKTY
jgi:SAM-dependent MidA family methyltransferase